MSALRQTRDDRLCWTGGLKVARAIGKSDHAIGIRHIHVTGVWSRRPESDAKRLVEVLRKYADVRLSAPLGEAQDANPSGSALSNEDVTARRNPEQARIVETISDKLDDKTRRRLRPGIGRPRQDGWAIADAGRRMWRRHVRRGNLAPHSWRIAAPIAVCRGAGQNGQGLTKGRNCRDADEGCRPNADLNCKYPIDVPQRQDSESLRCSGLKLDASTDVYQETSRFTIAPRTGSWHGYISP